MIRIVQGVQQIFVKGVNVLKAREAVKNGTDLFAKRLGGVFDLADVERC